MESYDYGKFLERFAIKVPEEQRRYCDHYAAYFKGRRRVADLGCGKGHFLEALQRAGVPCTGVEQVDSLVREITGKGFDCFSGDLFAFLETCPAENFDAFYLSHVIEHLHRDDLWRMISLARKALPPRGMLLLTFPNVKNMDMHRGEFWRDPTHVWFYQIDFVSFLLEEAGFETREYPAYVPAGQGPHGPRSLRERVRNAAHSFLQRQLGLKRHINRIEDLMNQPKEVCIAGIRKP